MRYPAVTYAAAEHQGRLFWITCKWLNLLSDSKFTALCCSAASMWHSNYENGLWANIVFVYFDKTTHHHSWVGQFLESSNKLTTDLCLRSIHTVILKSLTLKNKHFLILPLSLSRYSSTPPKNEFFKCYDALLMQDTAIPALSEKLPKWYFLTHACNS